MKKRKSFYLLTIITVFLALVSLRNSILGVDHPVSSWQKIQFQIKQSTHEERVSIDNIYIQTYRGETGVWKKIHYGATLAEIAAPYGANKEKIIKVNELPQNTVRVYTSLYIFIPYSKAYLKKLEESGMNRMVLEVSHEEYIWPVEGVRITSHIGNRWGKFHPGVDIATPTGTLVLAAMDGEIHEAGRIGDYGNAIILNHNKTYFTLYGHLSQIFVKKGDKIKKGQVIGLSGTSGKSTGPHLHFEVRYLNVVLNPEVFLPAFKESMYAIAQKEGKLEVEYLAE